MDHVAEIELRFENYHPALVCILPADFNTSNIFPAESDISFEEIVLSTKSL